MNKIKNLLSKIGMILVVLLVGDNTLKAQDGWDSGIPNGCFCCENVAYKLPKNPIINGARNITCDSTATYCVDACPGAVIQWKLTNSNIHFTGQGTNCITLIPPFPTGINSTSVGVSISCGNKHVSNKIPVTISNCNCNTDFLISQGQNSNGNGCWVEGEIQNPPTGIHLWALYQATSCTAPSTTWNNSTGWNAWFNNTPTILTVNNLITSPTPYGYKYTGLGLNQHYVLAHFYKCGNEWEVTTKCIYITELALKSKKGIVLNSKTESINFKDLPKEIQKELTSKNIK